MPALLMPKIPAKKILSRFAALLFSVAVFCAIAALGSFAAAKTASTGRILAGILRVEEVKAASRRAFSPQSLDFAARYLLAVTDKTLELDFTSGEYLNNFKGIWLVLPEDMRVSSVEFLEEKVIISGTVQSLAEDFLRDAADYGAAPESVLTLGNIDGSRFVKMSFALK